MKIEIDCIACDGEGWSVPYGSNGYEPQETCTTCNGAKKILIDVDGCEAL